MKLLTEEEADIFLSIVGGVDLETKPVVPFSKSEFAESLAQQGKTVVDYANEQIKEAEEKTFEPHRQTPRWIKMMEEAKAENERVLDAAREIIAKRK